MRRVGTYMIGLGCGLLWTSTGFGADAADQVTRLTMRDTGARVHAYQRDGRIRRLYGEAFATGASAQESAESFIAANGDLVGARRADLAAVGPFADGRHLQAIMPEGPDGAAKFTGVYYTQQRDGVPVFRTRLMLLARNTERFPVVLATTDLRDLGAFAPDLALLADPAMAGGLDAARRMLPGLVNVTKPGAVVWAGLEDAPVAPVLAWTFIADTGDAPVAVARYERWLFVTDARTGEVLYLEDQVVHADITGTVRGLATEGLGADICGPEVPTGLPYIRVGIQGNGEATATDGTFAFTDLPEEPTLIKAYMVGDWFKIEDQRETLSYLEQTVTPPAVVDFLHNPDNNRFLRAQINAYLHANVVRDYALAYSPDYPIIATEEQFRVRVNIDSNCNAYYDGQAINFFTRGGGCPNTAFSSVVYHEYGHHMVRTGGSGQGEYGEGMSDVVAVLVDDDPGLGYGFGGNCNDPLRMADNSCQYRENCSTCGQEVHACGRLISGCVWSLRNELAATEPDDYRAILSSLAINSILLHTGSSIRPEITIDYLVLDDDNGNLFDGAPHWDEIATAFAAHDMDVPELVCPADVDGSGDVTFDDILRVLSAWGPCDGCPEDIDQSGIVDFDDVLVALSLWGPCF